MCRNCVHVISCNRCSIFTCGCTSCVIILFLWFRFRPRMRTIRRLLQSLHWPNLHHEFLKWVRNSAGETCSLSLSQTNFRHRGQLYDTCFTLFLALPELIAILSTGYEVGVRDFLRGMEEASYDVMQLEILECLCRKPKRLFWWFFGVGFSYMLRRWFSHIQGDFNRWWFACQDFDRFDEIDLSRDDAESLRFCCFADLSREDYMY